jgi:hypothetical protein
MSRSDRELHRVIEAGRFGMAGGALALMGVWSASATTVGAGSRHGRGRTRSARVPPDRFGLGQERKLLLPSSRAAGAPAPSTRTRVTRLLSLVRQLLAAGRAFFSRAETGFPDVLGR